MTTTTLPEEHIGDQTAALIADERYPGPNLATIIAMRDSEYQRFEKFHQQNKKADEFYRALVKVPVAEGGQMIVLTTAHSIIETFADHIDTDHIQIDVRSGPRGQASAEIRAKFFAGVLHHSEQEKQLLYTSAKHIGLYGVTIIKRFHDAERWPDRPEVPPDGTPEDSPLWTTFANKLADFTEVRAVNFPIIDEAINPTSAIWDTSRGNKRWVMEKYQMTVEALKKWNPDFIPGSEHEEEVLEYWDDQWMAVIVNEKWFIAPRWHGYHTLPYAIMEPAMGIDSQDAPPEERYVGIITPALQALLIEESRLVSQYDTIVRGEAWPGVTFQGPPELVNYAKENWDVHPGAKNVLPDGVTLVDHSVRMTFPQLLEVLSIVRGYIEDDTLPSVIRGTEPTNRSSGFEVTARAGMARLRLRAAAKAIGSGVQQLNTIAAKLLEFVIREPVTVFAQTVSGIEEQRVRPRDVAGQYTSRVTLEAASPEDRVNRGMFGSRMFEAGLQSELMTRRDSLGQTNALEDMNQTRAEQLLKTEIGQQIMLSLFGPQAQAILAQLQAVQQSGGISPGGNSGQFGGGAEAAFATTSFPDQAGRSRAIIEARRPGSLQDIDRTMSQFGVVGAGPLRTGGGNIILPNGSVR